MKRVYLDYAATTPTDPEVIKAMEPYYFTTFGNPSSPHAFGQEAKKTLEDARQRVAYFIGAQPDEIIFTSGGTESNNHAIFGVARALRSKGNHIITSSIEHHSVKEVIQELEKEDFKVTYVGVDKNGIVDPSDIKKAINEKTILISIMHANNQIGTIQPIEKIGKIAKEHNVCFHCDAVQTMGQMPVHVDALNVDLLSLSAHKFYGPKGVGALYIRKGTKIKSFFFGGSQEKGQRASTSNLPGIVGLAKALEICSQKMEEETNRQIRLRDRIIKEVQERIPDVFLNGHSTKRLSKNINFSFAHVNGESLLMSLDMVGVAVSMGSACTAGSLEPSHVLKAIGVSDTLALETLRITIGRWTTDEDVDYFLEQLPLTVERLRSLSKAPSHS